ncbi:MAG: hypothetical protein HYU66_14895 [Armatimonadetes bacterium]|nr:hypothetical protein [Armatimonadota bacterium]
MRRCLLLCLPAARLLAAPTVFWASDPVRPGESVLVFGDGFGTAPGLALTRLADGPAGTPAERAVAWPKVIAEPKPFDACDSSLRFTLPASSKPGVFAFRLTAGGGSTVGLLNRPVVWWLQGDRGTTASPGGWLRLFGRNLGWPRDAGLTTTLLLTGPSTVRLEAAADVWSARAPIPAEVPPGDYRVRLHNGAGGGLAWSIALTVTIARPEPWPAKVYNARDLGAAGDGAADDTAALQSALDRAGEAGGGVVLLPRGRYRFSDTLRISRFVTLRGEGRDLACLALADLAKPPEALIRGTDHFAVEDLTLYAGYHRHLVVGDLGDRPDAGHVRLRRLTIRADSYRGHLEPKDVDERFRATAGEVGGDSLRLGGPNVEIGDCDVYGTGRALYLSRVKSGWVHDNHFYNGRWGWYCISGSDGLIFERNHLQGADLMSTGGGLNCLDGSTFSQNVYYAGNDLSLMHGWDREAMTSDAGGGPYIGQVSACDGTSLTLAAEVKWGSDWSGAGVFVLDGKGAGQARRVAKADGQRVTLDRPLDVPLDGTSELSITQFQGHYMILDNHFTDCGAMQFFGTAIENVVAGNVGVRMSSMHAWALWYYGFQPVFYCQFLGNRLSESYYHWTSADNSFIGLSGYAHEGYDGPLNLGGVIRGNQLADNAMIRVQGHVRDALIEGNAIRDADEGIYVSPGCPRISLRDNRFERVTLPLATEEARRKLMAERMRRYSGKLEPIAQWDFEQLRDGRFADASGNGFAAQVEGGAKPVADGRHGQGVALDGTGYLRVNETFAFNVPDVTIALWVKPAVLTGRRGLVSKRLGGAGCPFVVNQTGATVGFEAADDEGKWPFNFQSPAALRAGEWAHVTVVVKQAEGIRIYVDGKQVAEKLQPGGRSSNDQPLILGREAWGGDPPQGDTPGFFVGAMDEVRIWGRALSAEEVAGEAGR